MPKPIREMFFVPVVASEAAVASYLRQEAPEGQSFSAFFVDNKLWTPAGYDKFYSAPDVLEAANMLPPDEPVQDYIDYLRIKSNFDDLLDQAMLDVTIAYRAARMHLYSMDMPESKADASIVPILCHSKRFAHRVAGIPSRRAMYCMLNSIVEPALAAVHDAEGQIQAIDFTESTYRQEVQPHLTRQNGCPMLRVGLKTLYTPTPEQPSLPDTLLRRSVYDLYWNALTVQAHEQFMADRAQLDTRA